MAKELEAEDIELKEYAFVPSETEVDGTNVIDYTGVEHDRIFLVNKKNILEKERPAWIPELDKLDLKENDFLPPCVKDMSTGNYYVLNNRTVYKMSLDILAATVDYYLKREREYQKSIGNVSERIMLPRALKKMPTKRYNDIASLLHFCESYKEDFEKYPALDSANLSKKSKQYYRQNVIIFKEQYAPLLEAVKGKTLDLNYSKQDYIDSYSKGEETSYGNSLCFNNLYEAYGIRIKKQNGSTFSGGQIERIRDSVDKVWKYYGNLKSLAADYGLKVSYADNCMQHARQKAIGLFTPYYNAIGVSFFAEDKQKKIGQNHLSDITLSHEVAHWLDAQKGRELHRFFASDADGTLENKIATVFKDKIRKRERDNKNSAKIGKSDGTALGEYWFRTCECFARALEQSYATEQGIDLSEEHAYVQKAVFEKEIRPLVDELMKENARHFKLEPPRNRQVEIKPVALEDILGVMDMIPEVAPNGKIKIFDRQRKEYIDNGTDFEGSENEGYEFSDAADIFERLDIYIGDYYIRDIENQLDAVSIDVGNTDGMTLEELCKIYKDILENDSLPEEDKKNLSVDELSLAMGIVHPDTVIMPVMERLQTVEEVSLKSKRIETGKTIKINGQDYPASEVEAFLREDVSAIFRELDSGGTEQNLILNDVKIYGNPEKDGKIRLLAEFDSKNPMGKWREDSLFNAIAQEHITFNGVEVDVNPITPEKSGTISEYLERLESLNKKEIEKAEDISLKIDSVTEPAENLLPFSIINNEVKGRVNIKFDTVENNPDFQNIIRELKSNGWKFAPSTRQWYPVGKAVDKAADFANALQEKYSVPLNQKTEDAADINLKKSPYDGIRFFDRNCNESEEFARYFNSRLSEFEKNAGSISEKDASVILRAIGYADNGTPGDRHNRLGLDRKDNLVILAKQNSEVKAVTTDLKGLLDIAREQSEQGLNEANRMLENSKQNKRLPDELHDIFIRLYEECIEQRKEVYEKMNAIYDKYSEKGKTVSKEPVLYQRNSYRGWEISTSKDFARSVYFRPFDHAGRSGFVLMTGKEGADGFWQEKMLQELLYTDGWNDKKAVIEAVSAITGSKQACEELGIEYVSSANERLKQLSVISIDSGKEIKDEILGASEQTAEESTIERKIPELIPGEKCGNACAADVYTISDGVYQAALERVSDDGGTTVQNHFVLDKNIVSKLPVALQELTVSFGCRSVIENKRYEPYILRELIELKAMPPRDENFVEKLDEYISANPLKYEKLYPVTPGNFEDKLRQLSEIDKDLHKNPFELGQQLISMVDDSEKDTLNMWLVSKNCTSKENMEKIFASWIGSGQNIENTKKKDSGYPPRGEY